MILDQFGFICSLPRQINHLSLLFKNLFPVRLEYVAFTRRVSNQTYNEPVIFTDAFRVSRLITRIERELHAACLTFVAEFCITYSFIIMVIDLIPQGYVTDIHIERIEVELKRE